MTPCWQTAWRCSATCAWLSSRLPRAMPPSGGPCALGLQGLLLWAWALLLLQLLGLGLGLGLGQRRQLQRRLLQLLPLLPLLLLRLLLLQLALQRGASGPQQQCAT